MDEVIIDGCNVAECKNFSCGICQEENKKPRTMEHINVDCAFYFNCYYKQLQRLKAKNEKLKTKNEQLGKYQQALEEIKRLLTIAMDEETVSYLHFELIEKSIKEINEVLNDE